MECACHPTPVRPPQGLLCLWIATTIILCYEPPLTLFPMILHPHPLPASIFHCRDPPNQQAAGCLGKWGPMGTLQPSKQTQNTTLTFFCSFLHPYFRFLTGLFTISVSGSDSYAPQHWKWRKCGTMAKLLAIFFMPWFLCVVLIICAYFLQYLVLSVSCATVKIDTLINTKNFKIFPKSVKN